MFPLSLGNILFLKTNKFTNNFNHGINMLFFKNNNIMIVVKIK